MVKKYINQFLKIKPMVTVKEVMRDSYLSIDASQSISELLGKLKTNKEGVAYQSIEPH